MKFPWIPLTVMLAAIGLPLFTVQSSDPAPPNVGVLAPKLSSGGSFNLIVVEFLPTKDINLADERHNTATIDARPA